MLGDVLPIRFVGEDFAHGFLEGCHVSVRRTPADLPNRATDLLADHYFDSNNVGHHLGNLCAKLYRFGLFARQGLRFANKNYSHFILPISAREDRGERCPVKMLIVSYRPIGRIFLNFVVPKSWRPATKLESRENPERG
jgi:hypothetical protein